MPKEFFLVRHGNSSKVDEEGVPIDDFERVLSPQGREEVTRLALHLQDAGVQPDIIFTSPLVRTSQTADIIATYFDNPPIQTSELISESHFGELPEEYTMRDIEYGYHTERVRASGGETVDEVEARIAQFLDDVQALEHETILVTSHGLPLSVMSQVLEGVERTFENIRALKTADFNHYVIDADSELPIVLTARTNVLKAHFI